MSKTASLVKAATTQTDLLVVSDEVSLPVIEVMEEGAFFQAWIQSMLISKEKECNADIDMAYMVWGMSLVSGPGQWTSLQAVFYNLVSNTLRRTFVKGYGNVHLGHWREDLSKERLGYPIRWTMRTEKGDSSGAMHGLIEPRSLMVMHPALDLGERKDQAKQEKTTGGKALAQAKATISSTDVDGKKNIQAEEEDNRTINPLFIVTIPGRERGNLAYRYGLFRRMLDVRLSVPTLPGWGEYLWKKALERGEIEELDCIDCTPGAKEEGAPPPVWAEAWLCRVKPELVTKDIIAGLSSKVLPLGMTEPASLPQ